MFLPTALLLFTYFYHFLLLIVFYIKRSIYTFLELKSNQIICFVF